MAYGTDPHSAMMAFNKAALVAVVAPGHVIKYCLRNMEVAAASKYGSKTTMLKKVVVAEVHPGPPLLPAPEMPAIHM